MNDFKKTAKKIYDLIKKSDTIIIHRHVNPDGDALGSQWGLKRIIETNFPKKKVFVPGEMNDYMTKFFPKADVVNESDYQDALVLICDTANRERISGQFWEQARNIIKIDHHPEVDNYGTLNLVDSSAPAACQVVTKWAQVLKLKVPQDAAKYLYLGLVTDSGRFLYRSVSSETFDLASFLMKSNFSLLDLYETLYRQELKNAWVKGYILSNFFVSPHHVAYLILQQDDLTQLEKELNAKIKKIDEKAKITLVREDFTNNVNLLSNINGIKIWMIACQDSSNRDFKISVRSTRWKINDVVAQFGGGGHDSAAGARLENDRVVQNLFHALEQLADLAPNIK